MPKEKQILVSTCDVVLGDDMDTVEIEIQLPSGEGEHFLKHYTSFMKWFTEHAGGEYEQHKVREGRTH